MNYHKINERILSSLILQKGQYFNSIAVNKMKKYKVALIKAITSIAKNGLKNDINSTGSPWMFQPKIPSESKSFKNRKKWYLQ